MKTFAFVLMLSLLANLSFAGLTSDTIPSNYSFEKLDSACRDGLNICLIGNWMNIGQGQQENGFASLSMYGSGRFEGTDHKGKRICGRYEIVKDELTLVLHEICEKTGKGLGTFLAKIELIDGHMLSMAMPEEMGGKQLFIQ